MKYNMKNLKYTKVNLFEVFNNNSHKNTKPYVDGNGIYRINIAG